MKQKSKIIIRFFTCELLPILTAVYAVSQDWPIARWLLIMATLLIAINLGKSIYDGETLGSGGIICARADSALLFWSAILFKIMIFLIVLAVVITSFKSE